MAPFVDVLGSFFPIWTFCLIGGILATVLARLVLIRAGLDGEIGPRAIVYPSLVALVACSMWLLLFRS
jgi:hypothetical protein